MFFSTIWNNRVFNLIFGLLLAAGGGFLLSSAFPPFSKPFLAWIGLTPVLVSIFLFPRLQGVLNAATAGICYYTILYFWMQRFHRLSVIFIAILFGIVFFALPLLLAKWSIGRNRKLGFILLPSIWVIFEYLKTLGPLSFGFGILGYSQYTVLHLIQSADLWGVYGVSFLLVLINYTLFFYIDIVIHKEITCSLQIYLPTIIVVLLLAIVFGYGEYRLRLELSSLNLRVQLAQFHHDSHSDWEAHEEQYLDEYEHMTMISREFAPDLVIFPENSVKRFVSIDPSVHIDGSARILNRISYIASAAETSLLLGVLEASAGDSGVSHYNSAFLFDADGDLSGRYRKAHLVPFGEADPFAGKIPFLEEVLKKQTDVLRLNKGSGSQTLKVKNAVGEELKFGALICFEGTRPDFVRDYSTSEGVDFFVNITSDAWTGDPGALEQHAAFCVFRAIENRRTLYRVGNGGLSGVINPKGIIIKRLPYFNRGVLLSGLTVPEKRGPGLYIRFGDWFILICLLNVLTIFVNRFAVIKKRRDRVKSFSK